jgi:hypothetical protein
MKKITISIIVFNIGILIISTVLYMGILTDIKFLVDDPINNEVNNSEIIYLISAKLISIITVLGIGNIFFVFVLRRRIK